MSGKKLEVPPSASSSSDEDAVGNYSSSEEEETDSESEAVPVTKPLVKPPAKSKKVETSLKTQTKKPSSSEEEEEETDDSESEAEPVTKPPATSKKVETSSKPETKKRSSGAAEGEVKRVKMDDKKSSAGGEETKKLFFQRVWTEEDEVTVLQGIIDYKNQTGSNPDKNALYDLVKKSVSFDVTKTQFIEKIRGLKKKFERNLARGMKKGKDPSFSKAHDCKVFDLAKLVWGDNGIMAVESSPAVKSGGKSKKVELAVMNQEEHAVKKQEFVSVVELVVARFGVDDLAAKQGWSRLSAEDKERFEEQWNALQLKEFKFYSQKSGFIRQVVTKMAETSRPNL